MERSLDYSLWEPKLRNGGSPRRNSTDLIRYSVWDRTRGVAIYRRPGGSPLDGGWTPEVALTCKSFA